MTKSQTYQEADDSTFEQDGKRYSLNTLFRIAHQHPVVDTPIHDFDRIANGLNDMRKGTFVCQSCQGDTDAHARRVREADIATPVLTTRYKGKLIVVDGLHRLERAVREHRATLPARSISEQELAAAQIA